MPPDGRLLQINASPGGVPKLPVPTARIGWLGLEGDRQADATVHGGPHRAVSILGIEAIRRVAAEGHPIAPGTTGENLTTEGFDVSLLPPGTRLEIGPDVVLELASPAGPCRTIRHSFRELRFGRLSAATHPADSRMYARVIREGTITAGDPITVVAPTGDAAERENILGRLDDAERESSVALWRAAIAAGCGVELIDDGEIGVAAAPDLPGPIFNAALGFARLPNLVGLALDHFRGAGVRGWVTAQGPPWDGAVAESTFTRLVAQPSEVPATDADPHGVTVREMDRTEHGTLSRVMSEASAFDRAVAEAFAAAEPHAALDAHLHRFVAELDGRVVGVATLRTHHRVGWLRGASVLPEARGRGIQRALIRHRAAKAAALGCELVGAAALEGSLSAANLEACGLRAIGSRRSYRYDPEAVAT